MRELILSGDANKRTPTSFMPSNYSTIAIAETTLDQERVRLLACVTLSAVYGLKAAIQDTNSLSSRT